MSRKSSRKHGKRARRYQDLAEALGLAGPATPAPERSEDVVAVTAEEDVCGDCGRPFRPHRLADRKPRLYCGDGPGGCDKSAGTMVRDFAAISRGRVRSKPWNYRDGTVVAKGGVLIQPDAEVFVHGDGWTTAHAGTISGPTITEEDREAFAARFTEEEKAVVAAKAADKSRAEIARDLRLTLRQVDSRIASVEKKRRELAEAVRQFTRTGDRERLTDRIAKLRRLAEHPATNPHEAERAREEVERLTTVRQLGAAS